MAKTIQKLFSMKNYKSKSEWQELFEGKLVILDDEGFDKTKDKFTLYEFYEMAMDSTIRVECETLDKHFKKLVKLYG